MGAPPQDRKRKRNKSAPDEEPVMRWKNRGEGTREMCVCDCGQEGEWLDFRPRLRLGEEEGQAEEPDDVDRRCCCTQCGPVDVNSDGALRSGLLFAVGSHIGSHIYTRLEEASHQRQLLMFFQYATPLLRRGDYRRLLHASARHS